MPLMPAASAVHHSGGSFRWAFDAEGSAPLASSFSLTAGVASVLRTASLIALIVSRGVFVGTNSAYQLYQ